MFARGARVQRTRREDLQSCRGRRGDRGGGGTTRTFIPLRWARYNSRRDQQRTLSARHESGRVAQVPRRSITRQECVRGNGADGITDPREVELGGLRIPASEKVLLLLASANRDPEHWQEPDRFDPTRRIQGHVGFGVGFHACIGQVIARMEGELLLTALAQRRLDRAGRPADAPYQQRRPRLREPAARGAGGLKEKGARASGHTCFSDISARS